MSLQDARRFYQEIQQDADFFKLLQQTMQQTADSESDQTIVEFARKHGFNFSIQELAHFFNEASLINTLNSRYHSAVEF